MITQIWKKKERNAINKLYSTHHKIGIYFDYDISVANHLNYMRMYWFGEKLIGKVVYNTLNKYMDLPNENEFDTFIKYDKIFDDFKTDILYYF